jgi:hypothetical protein
MSFKGFQIVAAMILVSELGEIHRFAHPRQVMAYLGLVPTEDTSSDQRRQGGITKCGNSHARWLLIESAQHYVTPPKVSKELSQRQEAQPREVRAISWRAQNRLHSRFSRLAARRLQRNKALVAVARELCGFVWEVLRTQGCYQAQPDVFVKEKSAAALVGREMTFRWGTTVPQTPPLRGTALEPELNTN